MAEAVKFVGGDAWFDIRGDVVEDFRGQTTRHAHADDVFSVFDGDAHASDYPIRFACECPFQDKTPVAQKAAGFMSLRFLLARVNTMLAATNMDVFCIQI
jgi:hypothetical protein